MDEKRTIFREKALEKLSTPEEVDKLLVVMTPKGWIALLFLFILIVGALVWAFLGQIPVTVHGKGIILTDKGVFTITAEKSGVVEKVFVTNGSWVKEGSALIKLGNGEIVSRENGKLLEVYVNEGDFVKEGDIIAWAQYPIENGQEYHFYAFFPVEEGEKIKRGMKAKIGLENVDIASTGFLLGTVNNVSQFPVSDRSMLNRFHNRSIVELLKGGHSTVTRVEITLEKDEKSPSGYSWTTKNVAANYVVAGTIGEVSVTLEEKAPITYLLPILSKKSKNPPSINPDRFPEEPK